MRIASIVVAAAAMLYSSMPSTAATVQSVQGQVSANSGNGYQVVRSGAAVGPGTIVMASAAGSALIIYSDKCVVRVDPGAVVVVREDSPCKIGQVNYTSHIVGGIAVAGAVTGIILLHQKDDDKPASP